MNLALIQAKKILGNTSKNPAVGCVVVKNNCLISAAHTSLNGRPHAEKNAIVISGSNIKNSELYVTLEPCSHYGKTSPCVKAIIKNSRPDGLDISRGLKDANNNLCKEKLNKLLRSLSDAA